MGLRKNIPWRWKPGLLGNSQQHWPAVWPIGNSRFLFPPMERRQQPGPGFRESWTGQPTAWQTCSGKIPRRHNIGHLPQHHQDSKFLPTAIQFRTHQILRGRTKFRKSLLSADKQCVPHGRQENYVPCWDKKSETLYRSFVRAQAGTDSDRAASNVFFRLE